MVDRPPDPDRWDVATLCAVCCLLLLGYVVYPHRIFQYGVWLAIFTLWMAWFVHFGVKWLYAGG